MSILMIEAGRHLVEIDIHLPSSQTAVVGLRPMIFYVTGSYRVLK